MIDFKFNKNKLVPDIREYIKILISVIITVYVFKGIILGLFPQLNNLPDFWALVFWVMIITFFKDLINLSWDGRDYF